MDGHWIQDTNLNNSIPISSLLPVQTSFRKCPYLPCLLLQSCSLSLACSPPTVPFMLRTSLQEGRSGAGRAPSPPGGKDPGVRKWGFSPNSVHFLPLGKTYSPLLFKVWSSTSNLGFIWELVRNEESNEDSQALTQTQWIKMGILTRSTDELCAHENVGSTALASLSLNFLQNEDQQICV